MLNYAIKIPTLTWKPRKQYIITNHKFIALYSALCQFYYLARKKIQIPKQSYTPTHKYIYTKYTVYICSNRITFQITQTPRKNSLFVYTTIYGYLDVS